MASFLPWQRGRARQRVEAAREVEVSGSGNDANRWEASTAENVLAIALAAVIAVSGSYIAWKLVASLFIIVAAAFKYIVLAGVLLVLVLFLF